MNQQEFGHCFFKTLLNNNCFSPETLKCNFYQLQRKYLQLQSQVSLHKEWPKAIEMQEEGGGQRTNRKRGVEVMWDQKTCVQNQTTKTSGEDKRVKHNAVPHPHFLILMHMSKK